MDKAGNQPPAAAPGPDRILQLLRQFRFRYCTERELQEGVGEALWTSDIPFEREYRLPGSAGRIDFFLQAQCLGIEIKVQGGHSDVARQMHRYALCPKIKSLILLTTRKKHEALQGTINGKTLDVVSLWLQAM